MLLVTFFALKIWEQFLFLKSLSSPKMHTRPPEA